MAVIINNKYIKAGSNLNELNTKLLTAANNEFTKFAIFIKI